MTQPDSQPLPPDVAALLDPALLQPLDPNRPTPRFAELTTAIPPLPPADILETIRQVCDDLRQADEAHEIAIRRLADGGADPEAIAAYALEHHLRRFTGLGIGARPIETATAVVEALRLTGHMAETGGRPLLDELAAMRDERDQAQQERREAEEQTRGHDAQIRQLIRVLNETRDERDALGVANRQLLVQVAEIVGQVEELAAVVEAIRGDSVAGHLCGCPDLFDVTEPGEPAESRCATCGTHVRTGGAVIEGEAALTVAVEAGKTYRASYTSDLVTLTGRTTEGAPQ